MKTSAQHSDGSGLVFRGPFVYGRSTSGTLTFGSAATNRWHFSGKEDQDVDFGIKYTDFGARLYSPGHGRWIAPDPASEKYYDLSPYAYCANNPVNLVDPDGEKIYIWDPDENQYYCYQDGMVYDSTGKEYDGNNQFVRMMENTINQLYALNDGYINEVLSTLEDSNNDYLIAPGEKSGVRPISDYGKSLANEGKPVDAFIYISSDSSAKDGVSFTIKVIVAHELKHAYDYNEGKYKDTIPWNWDNGIDPAEISAVNFENRVRVRTKMQKRTKYSKKIPAYLLEDPWKQKTDK